MCPTLSLLENVLRDTYSGREGLSREFARDFSYVTRRFASEGMTFLTSILPSLGKSVLKGIEDGSYVAPMGFKTQKNSTLPRFLGGLFRSVFSLNGCLLEDPDAYAIQEIQVVCMLFYKVEMDYSPEKVEKVISSFVSVEEELRSYSLPNDPFAESVLSYASGLISNVLKGWDPSDINPKHGPGAVATGEELNGKFSFKRKFQHLHQEYPYYEYFSPSMGRLSFESGWYRQLEPSVIPMAKVVLVPKDSRGPRLISMEPLEIQWIQQGLSKSFVARIEASPLTRGKVNFEKQQINRDLAFESSITRELSTLDLESASDRVPLALVERIFPDFVLRKFLACRSTCTLLPDGRILPLRKFAPMGSALCFPVMALTLWALATSILHLSPSYGPGKLAGRVYVYGDDILVPTDSTCLIFEHLEDFFLRINRGKSYSKGFFRESCGMDAFKGVVTTPLRSRQVLEGKHTREPKHYSHILSLSEAFFDRGYWGTARFLRVYLSKTFGALHWTSVDSDGLRSSDTDVCLGFNTQLHRKSRWNVDLQRWECLVRTIRSPRVESEISLSGRLLKDLANPSGVWSNPLRVTKRRSSVFRFDWRPV